MLAQLDIFPQCLRRTKRKEVFDTSPSIYLFLHLLTCLNLLSIPATLTIPFNPVHSWMQHVHRRQTLPWQRLRNKTKTLDVPRIAQPFFGP